MVKLAIEILQKKKLYFRVRDVQYSSSSSGSLRIPSIFPTDLTLLITCNVKLVCADICDFDDDHVDGSDDDDHLLLDKVKTHGNHGNAKEKVERAEGNPLLSILHLLVWCQVPKTNSCQSDETEVGAEDM